jgi:hypothetical protein
MAIVTNLFQGKELEMVCFLVLLQDKPLLPIQIQASGLFVDFLFYSFLPC